MKLQVEEMTSNEAKKLVERENILAQKERDLAIAQVNVENDKKRIEDSGFDQKMDQGDFGPVTIQLKKAVEEVHILREEKRYLLERCNKLSHDLRTTKLENSCKSSPRTNYVEGIGDKFREILQKKRFKRKIFKFVIFMKVSFETFS